MLTEIAVRAARPKEKPYKVMDKRGLHLLVKPNGARLWRFRYWHNKVEKALALGVFPDVGLKRAREKRDDARKLLADGIDPSAERKAAKAAVGGAFRLLAEEWFAKQTHLAPSTRKKNGGELRALYKAFGSRPLPSVTAPELLAVVRGIEARGTRETAHRVCSIFSRIARYAIATGRAERDVSADLRGALAAVVVTHHPAITDPKAIGPLLRALDGYEGQPATTHALRLAPLVFLRPGELRAAKWSEFDLNAAEPVWRVPAERMKMKEMHIVPLSRQAVALLRELQVHTGGGELTFPGLGSEVRPISENTINAALRRLGYSKKEMTGHGFRTTASTLLNEQGWHPDLIELQLAHAERNKVRAAYNKAQRLGERRKMMQAWADYLDGLRAGDKKVVGKKRAKRA